MDLLDELTRVCPDASAREARPDDAVDGVTPEVVVLPRGTEEVAAVARLAASRGRTVVARGAGTKLDWAGTPSSAEVVIDLSRMDAVLEHASGDLVARVQAGARLAAIDRQLAEARQWLPVDEVVPGSTIGGVVATGICGPSRYLHGAVRDLVIGVTVVRADGVVARSGSKVVKNVAGYDLAKLFTGSYGTLGIVTEAIFRLRPSPEHRRYVTATCTDEAALAPVLADVLHAQQAATAIEVDRRSPAGPIALAVLVEGRAGPVEVRARAIAELLGASDDSEERPAGWGTLPGPVTLKVTAELTSVPALLGLVRRLAGEHRLLPVVRGSAGVGVLFVGLAADIAPRVLAAFLGDLRVRCQSLGGSAIVLRAPAATKGALDVWGPVPGLELMRRVKQQFDPERRLAPGRFVGGI